MQHRSAIFVASAAALVAVAGLLAGSGCKRSPSAATSAPAPPPAVATAPAGPAWVPHVSDDGRVALPAPPDWEAVPPAGGFALALVGPPREGAGLTATANVGISTLTASQSPAVLAEALVTPDVRAAIADFKLLARNLNVTLAGRPAARVVYSGRLPGRADVLTWSQTVARDGTTGYKLTCVAQADDYEAVRPTFERMAQSLQIRPAPTTLP